MALVRVKYLSDKDKFSVRIRGKYHLIDWFEAGELLAELQVVFHERNLAERSGDAEALQEREGR